jgi:hypothetical protein
MYTHLHLIERGCIGIKRALVVVVVALVEERSTPVGSD